MAEVLSSTTRGNGYRLSQGKIRLKKKAKIILCHEQGEGLK